MALRTGLPHQYWSTFSTTGLGRINCKSCGRALKLADKLDTCAGHVKKQAPSLPCLDVKKRPRFHVFIKFCTSVCSLQGIMQRDSYAPFLVSRRMKLISVVVVPTPHNSPFHQNKADDGALTLLVHLLGLEGAAGGQLV